MNITVKELPVKRPDLEITLKLTMDEAEMVKALFGHVIGNGPARDLFDAIYESIGNKVPVRKNIFSNTLALKVE